MSEDDELLSHEHFSSDHSAHYDQQLAKARDLLPQAKAFILCLLMPDEEEGQEGTTTYVMIGKVPGIGTIEFLSLAMHDIVETVNEAVNERITRTKEEKDD